MQTQYQTPQKAASKQGLYYLLTECSIEIRIKMKNITQHHLKRKLTGPIDKSGIFIDRSCYLCFSFVMLSCLFIPALWSCWERVNLCDVLLCVFFSLSHVVSFNIFASLYTLTDISLASILWDVGKQRRPGSYVAKRGV